MSETKDRNRPIPAEHAGAARPWRLPYWTDEPVYAVEKEEPEANEDDDSEHEEPIRVSPPTAEELEKIRREAYNDGLEQGLVEGRQQGVQKGREEGMEEGRKLGYDAGFSEGKDAGNRAGYDEGKQQAAVEAEAVAGRLNRIAATLMQGIAERDRELPQVMVNLLSELARNVLGHELTTSNQAIRGYVEAAMEALPGGEKAVRILVSSDDAELIQEVSEEGLNWPPMQIDKRLECGEGRVESEHSRVEYSASEHLKHTLEELAARMLAGAGDFPDDDELSLVDVAPEEEPMPDSDAEITGAVEEAAEEEASADAQTVTEAVEEPQEENTETSANGPETLSETEQNSAGLMDEDDDPVIPSPPADTEKTLKYAFDNREPQNFPEEGAEASPSPDQDSQNDDPEPPLG